MITVFLHGKLRKYGTEYKFDAKSPAEIIRCLCTFIKGFRKDLSEGNWRLVSKDVTLSYPQIYFPADSDHLHIYPAVEGSGPIIGIIAGAALIGGSFLIPTSLTIAGITVASLVFNTGVALLFSGIAGLLAPTPRGPETRERPEERPSFIFQNVVNMTEQGGPVPLAYGTILAGSVVVSGGISTSSVNSYQPPTTWNFFGIDFGIPWPA